MMRQDNKNESRVEASGAEQPSPSSTLQTLKDELAPGEIAVMGLGMEGTSTLRFLRTLFPGRPFWVADRKQEAVEAVLGDPALAPLHGISGDDYVAQLANTPCTRIFKSPGIPLMQVDAHISLERLDSQTQLFLRHFRDRIIGITGSKGKSTTSALLALSLREAGQDAVLVGNIGIPVLNGVLEDVPGRLYVFEMSSHMLETADVSPHTAVLLNIYEEHLDHYRSYQHYADAKLNLLRHQGADDIRVVGRNVFDFCGGRLPGQGRNWGFADADEGSGDDGGEALTTPSNAEVVHTPISDATFQGFVVHGGMLERWGAEGRSSHGAADFPRHLVGRHNLLNLLVCMDVLAALGLPSPEPVVRAAACFRGLEHRLEYVETVQGIRFYNDSISTIPQAAIAAVKGIPEVDTLILGGMDRGIDYAPLVAYLSLHPVPHVLCMPTTGHKVHDMLRDRLGTEPDGWVDVPNLEEAVQAAFVLTQPGKACVLSPAAASYGYFRNFEARGAAYKELVMSKIVE